LLLALLGADVIGIDLNQKLIDLCNKRKTFYRKYCSGMKIEFAQRNVFEYDFSKHAPIDCIYSLFAFNLMRPTHKLLERITPFLSNQGKIHIIDTNTSSIYNKIIKSRRRPDILNPSRMQMVFENAGYKTVLNESDCMVPPFLFNSNYLQKTAIKVEKIIKALNVHRYFGVSYTIIAQKI
jgi:hypothetical protein